MKRTLLRTITVLVIVLYWSPFYAQNIVELDSPQQDQEYFDNKAIQEVHILPGYDFLTGELHNDEPWLYTNPQMRARIDFSIIGPMQSGDVFDQSDFDSSIDTSRPVINLSGSASVSASGGAVYSLPIALPRGTAGMEPSISLNYNSQGGSGLLGQGWNLSAVSSISRVSKNVYNDNEVKGIQMDNTDVFAMDGNRLMVTNGGTYGADGTQYGTEIETFVRVTSIDENANGIPDYFTAETKDGKLLTYGKQYRLGGIPYSWMLTRVEDAYGNYMIYKYLVEDDEIRLDEIVYTGNDSEGVTPYNIVQFHYIDRQDKNTMYMNGHEMNSNILLEFIDIRSNGTLFSKYTMNYGYNNGKTFLNEIVQSNSEGSELNPLKFVYDQETMNVTASTFDPNIWNGDRMSYGDFNGDGLGDYISYTTYTWTDTNTGAIDVPYEYLTSWTLHINNGDGTYTAVNSYNYLPPNFGGTYTYDVVLTDYVSNMIGDYDGDGINDFCTVQVEIDPNASNADPFSVEEAVGYFQINHVSFFLSSNNFQVSFITLNIPQFSATNLFKTFFLGDFDGNKAVDVLLRLPTGGVFLCPSLSGSAVKRYSYDFPNEKLTVLDYNGDGISDILAINESNSSIVSLANGFENSYYLSFNTLTEGYPSYWHPSAQVGDFNGDGLSDLLFYYPPGFPAGWASNWPANHNTIIALSKGSGGFIEKSFNFGSNDFVYIIDINADGKSDILGLKSEVNVLNMESMNSQELYDEQLENGCIYSTEVQNYSRLSVFVNNALNFENESFLESNYGNPYSVFEFIAGNCDDNYIPPISFTQKISSFLDIDGDGYLEIKIKNENKVVRFYQNETHQALAKIKDGFGNITEINYKPLTDETIYTKGNHADPKVIDIQPALFVASQIKTKNPAGGDNITQYKYEEALVHKEGKGFLGFMKTYNQSFATGGEYSSGVTNITNYNYNHFNYTTYFISQQSFKVNDPVGAPFVTEAILSNYYRSTHFYSLGNRRIISKITNDHKLTYFPGAGQTSYTENTYTTNNDGNTTDVVTHIKNGSLQTTQTTTLHNTYASYGNWGIPNLVTSSTTSVTRTGNPTITKTKTYSYNDLGGVTQQVDHSGTDKAVTTEIIGYNGFGLPLTSNLSATGEGAPEDQMLQYQYDSQGRFVVKTFNPIGQVATVTHHPVWGTPTSKTDISGQTITYTYDEWGRVATTTAPNGQTTTTTSEWITGDPAWGESTPNTFTDAMYRMVTTTDGSPTVTKTYNRFGMKLKNTVESHLAGDISTITTYNNKGQTVSVSEPHYDGAPSAVATNQYDEYGRVTQSNFTPLGGASIATTYIYEYTTNDLWKTTSNSPSGTTVSYKDVTGQIVRATDETGQDLYYEFYSDGQPKNVWLEAIGNNGQLMSHITYDNVGRQKTLVDPNAGTTEYWYNAVGQLYKQEDGNGNTFEMDYDELGRILTKTSILPGQTDVYTYEYVMEGNGLNALQKVTAPNGYYTEYTYGEYNRLMSITENIESEDFITSFQYDNYGRVTRKEYPSGFATRQVYTSNGFLDAVTTDDQITTIWHPENQNAKGIYTTFALGNGYSTTTSFDNKGMPTQILTINDGDNYLQDLNMNWDNNGNLLQRQDNVKGLVEDFTYNINRLESYQVSGLNSMAVAYLPNGNIGNKTDAGAYTYEQDGPNLSPHAVSEVDNPNNIISLVPQSITYTNFNSTKDITQDLLSLSLDYGADQQRRRQVYEVDGTIKTTHYYVGSYEKIVDEENNITREVNYISGGNGTCAIWVIENGLGSMHYLYRDHLGSIVTVTDDIGTVEFEQNFDPWGRYRDPNTWQYLNQGLAEDHDQNSDNIADWVDEIAGSDWSWFRRGYTGHEMLPEFGLINMNGRAYDPVLGRMLQVDNYVQNPFSSQSYNRYSYVLNNPLRYTDPSGEFIHIVIAAVIGGVINWGIHGAQFNAKGLLYFGVGAVAGGLSAGVASGVGANLVVGGTFKAGFMGTAGYTATGFTGGFVTGLAAGFTNGFVAGFGSDLVSGKSFSQSLGHGIKLGFWQGLTGGVIGGTIGGINAVINNRNFWTGAPRQFFYPEMHYSNLGEEISNPVQGDEFDNSGRPLSPKMRDSTRLQNNPNVTVTTNPNGNTTYTIQYSGELDFYDIPGSPPTRHIYYTDVPGRSQVITNLNFNADTNTLTFTTSLPANSFGITGWRYQTGYFHGIQTPQLNSLQSILRIIL